MIIDEAVKARFWAKVDKGKAPDACWTVRRAESKTNNARAARDAARSKAA